MVTNTGGIVSTAVLTFPAKKITLIFFDIIVKSSKLSCLEQAKIV